MTAPTQAPSKEQLLEALDPGIGNLRCYNTQAPVTLRLSVGALMQVREIVTRAADEPPDDQAVACALKHADSVVGDSTDALALRRLAEAVRAAQPPKGPHFGFVEAMNVADGVFEQYRKDQLKWWKRMDGTPILNDVAVRMAQAFLEATQGDAPTKASPPDCPHCDGFMADGIMRHGPKCPTLSDETSATHSSEPK